MIRIETELFIAAPPEKIWAALMDFDNYKNWNEFILSIKGNQEKGARLKVHIRNPDASGRIMQFAPKITVFEENKMLAWKGSFVIPFVLDGVHYFRLAPAGKGTLFTHGEAFSGLLAQSMRKTILEKYPKAFGDMNIALAKYIA